MLEDSTPSNGVVTLSAEESATLAEYQQLARDAQQQALGALKLILRQRSLEGEWSVKGDKIVRQQ